MKGFLCTASYRGIPVRSTPPPVGGETLESSSSSCPRISRRRGALLSRAEPAAPALASFATRGDARAMITRLGTKVGTTDEMRLRSGHRVGVSGPAAKMPTSAAEARALLMRDGMRTSPLSVWDRNSEARRRRALALATATGRVLGSRRLACPYPRVAAAAAFRSLTFLELRRKPSQ